MGSCVKARKRVKLDSSSVHFPPVLFHSSFFLTLKLCPDQKRQNGRADLLQSHPEFLISASPFPHSTPPAASRSDVCSPPYSRARAHTSPLSAAAPPRASPWLLELPSSWQQRNQRRSVGCQAVSGTRDPSGKINGMLCPF